MENLNYDLRNPFGDPDTQKSQKEIDQIERNLLSVFFVVNRIYQPIAQKRGISLLLRNEINTEIQFPSRFFINLIQITENLVANAVRVTPSSGLVDVIFSLDVVEDLRILNMNVTDTGRYISPDLVLAFNQGKPVAKLMGGGDEDDFSNRLEYVMQLVSKEGGRIFVRSVKVSETTFSLTFPLQDNYLIPKNGFQHLFKNGEMSLNGS